MLTRTSETCSNSTDDTLPCAAMSTRNCSISFRSTENIENVSGIGALSFAFGRLGVEKRVNDAVDGATIDCVAANDRFSLRAA